MRRFILFLRMIWVIVTTTISCTIFLIIAPIDFTFLMIRLSIGDYFKIKKVSRFQYSH